MACNQRKQVRPDQLHFKSIGNTHLNPRLIAGEFVGFLPGRFGKLVAVIKEEENIPGDEFLLVEDESQKKGSKSGWKQVCLISKQPTCIPQV